MSARLFSLRRACTPQPTPQRQPTAANWRYFDALTEARNDGQEQGERIGWQAGAAWGLAAGFCWGAIAGGVVVAVCVHYGVNSALGL